MAHMLQGRMGNGKKKKKKGGFSKYERRADSSTGHNKVVSLTHAPYSLDDFALVVRNNFYAL